MASVETSIDQSEGSYDIYNPFKVENPEHFGRRGEVIRASYERLKFLHDKIISNTQQTSEFKEMFNEYENLLEKVLASEFIPTRLQGQAIFDKDLIGELSKEDWFQERVEVIFPIDEVTGGNHVLVYISKNSKSRRTGEAETESVAAKLDKEIGTSNYETARDENPTPRDINEIMQRPIANGYEIGVLEAPWERNDFQEIVTQIHQLYQTFGWTDIDAVETLLRDPSYLFTVARKDGEIVSVGLAEFTTLEVEGVAVPLVELTEASSAQEHQGQGLYTAIATRAMIEITGRAKEKRENIISFSESNNKSIGVHKSGRYQWRYYVRDHAADLGYPNAGTNEQQVTITIPGETRHSIYNDLSPNCTTPLMMEERYGPYVGSEYQTYIG